MLVPHGHQQYRRGPRIRRSSSSSARPTTRRAATRLEYRWTLGGTDAARFTIMTNVAGERPDLRFQAIPDYESPLDDGQIDNVYNGGRPRCGTSKINTVGNTNGDPDTAVDDTIAVDRQPSPTWTSPARCHYLRHGGGRRGADGVRDRH